MNSEDSTPLQPWTDPELEARVVALILGEASDFEREEIERHLAEQPELRLFKERIEEVHGLLGGRPEPQDWRLSEERRGKVLAAISSSSSSKSKSGSESTPWWAHPAFRIAAAVMILGAIGTSLMLPAGFPFPGRPKPVTVNLASSDGLHPGANVMDNGDRIGSIVSITKSESGVEAKLGILPGKTIPEGTKPQVTTSGLLGDTSVTFAQKEREGAIPSGNAPTIASTSEPPPHTLFNESAAAGRDQSEFKGDAFAATSPPPPPLPSSRGFRIEPPKKQIEAPPEIPATSALAKSGSGTFTLDGTDTYTVGMKINAGVVASDEGKIIRNEGRAIPNGSGSGSGGAIGAFGNVRDDAPVPPPAAAPAPIGTDMPGDLASSGSAMVMNQGEIQANGEQGGRVRLSASPEEPAPSPEAEAPGTARKAVARRQETVAKADEAAIRGQRLLADKDYNGAARELKRSLDLLPNSPVVESRRQEYTQQFADASLSRARELAEAGNYTEAIQLTEKVLDPAVAPQNAKAKELLADLKDPEIYQAAITPEHIARAQKVESAVKEAASRIQTGDYDAAEKSYQEALKYDPYNSAARRGLEDVEKHMAAKEQATASDPFSSEEMLQGGTAELPAKRKAALATADDDPSQVSAMEYVVDRLNSIIIPELEFEDTPLQDALAFLEQKSFELDDLEPDPGRKGLKIVIPPAVRESISKDAPTIYLKLTRASFAEALRYVTELAQVSYKVEGNTVVIEPVKVESITPPPPPVTLETDASTEPFSTFSLHVSDVSFQLAQAALAKTEWPDKDSVRIEEFVNAFDYGDPSPGAAEPVACRIEQAAHPFLQERNVLRFGIRTASSGRGASSPLRLTLLLDRSGSMERPDRQEIIHRALEQLAAEMRDGDELTVIAFARQPRLVAERANRETAAKLIEELAEIPTEGGTNLEAALALAAEKARATRTPGAQNRIVLLTDGAANLGDANPDRLADRIHALRQDGIAFDAAGIGADGLNDRILEALTRKGDGRYYLLNRPEDAGEGFAHKLAGAFRPGAKDVKVQIQFNPDRVGRYRLLGFEEHRLNKEDFRDDTVDAAEMAAEEAGVAVYQVEVKPNGSGDVGFVSVRFLDVASGERVERRWLIPFEAKTPAFDQAAPSLRLAGLAAWTAAKLKEDPAAASTDWVSLNRLHAQLPEPWTTAPKVLDLGQMLRAAEGLAGSR